MCDIYPQKVYLLCTWLSLNLQQIEMKRAAYLLSQKEMCHILVSILYQSYDISFC